MTLNWWDGIVNKDSGKQDVILYVLNKIKELWAIVEEEFSPILRGAHEVADSLAKQGVNRQSMFKGHNLLFLFLVSHVSISPSFQENL